VQKKEKKWDDEDKKEASWCVRQQKIQEMIF